MPLKPPPPCVDAGSPRVAPFGCARSFRVETSCTLYKPWDTILSGKSTSQRATRAFKCGNGSPLTLSISPVARISGLIPFERTAPSTIVSSARHPRCSAFSSVTLAFCVFMTAAALHPPFHPTSPRAMMHPATSFLARARLIVSGAHAYRCVVESWSCRGNDGAALQL